MGTLSLFPTKIYQAQLPSKTTKFLNKGLLHDIEILSKKDLNGIRWCKKNYIGGYTSYNSITDLHLRFPDFMKLEKEITKHVNRYAKKLNWDLESRRLQMTTCWVNVMPKHTYHSLHIHPLSVISGTYYVKTPRKASSLKLEDPKISYYMNSPSRKTSAARSEQPYYHIQPKPGDLVLFESWMRHEVPPNQAEEARISISFNYEW